MEYHAPFGVPPPTTSNGPACDRLGQARNRTTRRLEHHSMTPHKSNCFAGTHFRLSFVRMPAFISPTNWGAVDKTKKISDSRPVPFCITGELEVSFAFHRFAFPSSGNLYGSLPIRDACGPSGHQFLIVNLRYESKFRSAAVKSNRPLDRI